MSEDTLKQLPEEEVENVEELSEEKTDIELTDEQAKKVAKEVSKLQKWLERNRPLKERRKAKLIKLEEKLEALPEGHYQIAQLQNKIELLKKQINPKCLWSASDGTYVKEKSDAQ